MNGRLAASSPLQGEALKVRDAHLDSASALARPMGGAQPPCGLHFRSAQGRSTLPHLVRREVGPGSDILGLGR